MKLVRLILQDFVIAGGRSSRVFAYAFSRRVRPLMAAALFAGSLSGTAAAQTATPRCNNSLDLIRLASPLTRVSQRLATRDAITIVAIGSSSTAGAGASAPDKSYPSQLQAELKVHFRGHPVTMINRGVNGEEIAEMLKRFDSEVLPAKPDLVLWQLGTNSVIRDHKASEHDSLIRAGLRKLRGIGADVVLVDPQYVPRVIAKPEAEPMVNFLAAVAKRENVDLFRRYETMKQWYQADHLAFDTFVSPDGLHLNDWGYACMAKGLGDAIAEAAQRPVQAATAVSSVSRLAP